MNMTGKNKKKILIDIIAKIAKWAFIVFFVIMTVLPLVWLVITSFKSNLEYETQPLGLPKVWQFSNYTKALSISGLPRLFLNSVIVAVLTTALNLIVASMGGFALAREKFFGREAILSLLLAGVLIPIIAFMVPYFSIATKLKLYDSLLILIIVYSAINIPVSLFLIYGFMSDLPKELEEAAVIDGCSFFQRFSKVIFPLTKPGLVTAGTLVFIYCWNEFTYAMLLTSSVDARTLQLGIRFFKGQFVVDYTSMLAAIVLTMLPTVVVYIFLHDKIISGMTAGAVKG